MIHEITLIKFKIFNNSLDCYCDFCQNTKNTLSETSSEKLSIWQ